MSQVHAKYLLIKNKTTGVDPLVDKILAATEEDKDILALYQRARALFLSDVKRIYVEACLLASKDILQIAEVIEMAPGLIEMYRDIFFDIRDYDKLSLLELVQGCDNPEERGMKLWALSQGLTFIAWRLGKAVTINPVEGLQDLFTLSIFKSKEALFSGNNSESSKEGGKWARLSMDLARILKSWVSDGDAAKQDIELALMAVIPDFKGFDSLDR